jgi:UDP-2-acetamido-3-amino-2,3-dideoxy-glucuronate N-acetyltransferase
MEKTKKSVGLVGIGYWGRNIFRNLYEMEALHTCCDSDPEVLASLQRKYPNVGWCPSFSDLLRNPQVQAVAIATPASTHYSLAREALLAGKDVLVEKPLALTVQEGEELLDIAAREKRVLMVGHILLYHPAVDKLREMISTGVLGKVEYVYSNRLNIGKLRTEENILWSFAPHDISVMLLLLQEEPVKVSAFGGDYLNPGIYDTTLTFLEFPNGVKGHIFVSWLHPYKEQKLIVVGTQAMAVFDDLSAEKLFLYPHKIEWKNGKIPVAQKAKFEPVPVAAGEPLRIELEHFLACVGERKKPLSDGYEGLQVLRVLDLAEKGLKQWKVARKETQKLPYEVHASSWVDEGVVIGEGTRIWHFCHLLKGTIIGKSCTIGQNVMIGPEVTIGDRCKIQNNVSIYKGVTLEDEVFCGPSCVFTNVYNPRAFIERKHEFRPTRVKRGATLGANSTIVCGVTIGMYAMVGAGSVVKGDIPDYAVVAGVPAERIGWVCRCGTTLKFDGQRGSCPDCRGEYSIKSGSLVKHIPAHTGSP